MKKLYLIYLINILIISCNNDKIIEYKTGCNDIEVNSDIMYIIEMNMNYISSNNIQLVKRELESDSCMIILKDGKKIYKIYEIPTDLELLEIMKEFYK